jgi:hypothetical protein
MPPTEFPPDPRHAGPYTITESPTDPRLLPPEAGVRLRQEAALVERFVECYRGQFDALIRRLNETTRTCPGRGDPAADSVRLCVEAVNMMLATHGQMARALRQLGLPQEAAAAHQTTRAAA